MTSIKPPTGPTVPLPTGPLEGALQGALQGTGAIADSAGAGSTAGVAGSAGAAPTAATANAGAADPIAQLAAAVARGELTSAQAVDQMIERAVADMSAHLDAAQRAELASVMRAAFEGDPVLRAALEDPAG